MALLPRSTEIQPYVAPIRPSPALTIYPRYLCPTAQRFSIEDEPRGSEGTPEGPSYAREHEEA